MFCHLLLVHLNGLICFVQGIVCPPRSDQSYPRTLSNLTALISTGTPPVALFSLWERERESAGADNAAAPAPSQTTTTTTKKKESCRSRAHRHHRTTLASLSPNLLPVCAESPALRHPRTTPQTLFPLGIKSPLIMGKTPSLCTTPTHTKQLNIYYVPHRTALHFSLLSSRPEDLISN